MPQQSMFGGGNFRAPLQFHNNLLQGSSIPATSNMKYSNGGFCSENTPNLLDDTNFLDCNQPMIRSGADDFRGMQAGWENDHLMMDDD